MKENLNNRFEFWAIFYILLGITFSLFFFSLVTLFSFPLAAEQTAADKTGATERPEASIVALQKRAGTWRPPVIGEAFFDKKGVASVWPEISIVREGDYREFADVMSKLRAETRKELMGEMVGALEKLSEAGGDVTALAPLIFEALLEFDRLYEQHVERAHDRIPQSIASHIKGDISQIFRDHKIRESSRRFNFTHGDLVRAVLLGRQYYQRIRIADTVDYVVYGSYTVNSSQKDEMVTVQVHIQSLKTGDIRTFQDTGSIRDVSKKVAEQIFDFFQEIDTPDWQDPNAQLTWMPPVYDNSSRIGDVQSYCPSQGGRLPYAEELKMAQKGGRYRSGGVVLVSNRYYAVRDRKFKDEPYYLSTYDDKDPRGKVRTSAGRGIIDTHYICVQGQAKNHLVFLDRLYRLYRENDWQPDYSDIRRAVSYLIAQYDNYVDKERLVRNNPVPNSQEAILMLNEQGIQISLPVAKPVSAKPAASSNN